jgi:hypothetical protein
MSKGDERGRTEERAGRGRGPPPGPRRQPTPASSAAAIREWEVQSPCQGRPFASRAPERTRDPVGVPKADTTTKRVDSSQGLVGRRVGG